METYPSKFKAFSHQGLRAENQDCCRAHTADHMEVRSLKRGELFVVADGMGGHLAGREAADEVCERLVESYFGPDLDVGGGSPEEIEHILGELLAAVNMHLYQAGKASEDRSGWGCTASALVLHREFYALAHAGDTRIYRLRPGAAAELLTEDQNVAYQMFKYGQISHDEYLEGFGSNKLLSYVGQGKDISVFTACGPLAPGDVFLMCSDGLNQFAAQADLERLVQAGADAAGGGVDIETLYRLLTEETIRPAEARDNVTFLLVEAVGR